ncbi:MAG: transposase [Candidatus Omnitrophota bacterium]
MPRIPRFCYETGIFHVMKRGNNRQVIFKANADFRRYLYLLKKYKHRYKFKLYAYCLLPNHIHLLLECQTIKTLSKAMQGIGLSYCHWHKKQYEFTGHLFQGRFKSSPIGKESYLLGCARYIELNPVRSGLVFDPSDYPWSSYNAYAFGKADYLVDVLPEYLGFGHNDCERQKQYREFVLAERPGDTLQA